jgi:hypothetical protein
MIRLLHENLHEFALSIPLSSLSKTFREAVEFTHQIGISYLWIDALCIIQDSEEDWSREALLMSSVYSNSYLNLAATSSVNGNGGLFLPQNPLVANPCMIEASWEGLVPGKYICVDSSAYKRRVNEGPLNQRAWVLQERLLAPRVVHFAYDQLWWECSRIRACESFPEGVPEESCPISPDVATSFWSLYSKTSVRSWLDVVQRYTECGLTKMEDKFVAIAGIAKTVQALTNAQEQDYLAGLWRSDLVKDLLWHTVSAGIRPQGYRAPSWSWASVEGAVTFNDSGARSPGFEPAIEVLDAQVDSSNAGSNFGLLKHGYLKVAASVFQVSLHEPRLSAQTDDPFLETLVINEMTLLYSDKAFSLSLDDERLYCKWPAEGRRLLFCHFGTTMSHLPALNQSYMSDGLLLGQIPSRKGEYERIGWLRIFHDVDEDEFHRKMKGPGLREWDYLERRDDGKYVILIV